MVGRTVSHYEVVERIGQGAMGVVYKALDLQLGRPVALKFLSPHLVDSEEAVARFQREAQAISALNHPNIGTIYELGESEDEIFLALEFLPGGTLRSLIGDLASTGRQLSPKQLLAFALGIAEGLAHAHRCGIIHRDLKTENVMRTAEGTVKITDFGLAKHRGWADLTRAGTIIGTASYMSPEQACGLELDHRSDIFSFGVVLFEMATGQLPFQGAHEAAVLSRILNGRVPHLREFRGDLSPAFESVAGKALQKDREKRYRSMDELLDDLSRVSVPATANWRGSGFLRRLRLGLGWEQQRHSSPAQAAFSLTQTLTKFDLTLTQTGGPNRFLTQTRPASNRVRL